ncbi:MAG: SET domain-containing protein [Candidatus Liptonbacteria bacterium]|nr:SET domain-containing protein [Candidatus Liptonbacteria bacterium]
MAVRFCLGPHTTILIRQRHRLFNLKVPKGIKMAYIWGKGIGVLADKNFKSGETAIHFRADTVPNSKASPEAVRIDEKWSYDTKWLTAEAFMNHSCDPNTKLDVAKKSYVAIKPIKKNEELTFNYNTTEWESSGFECACGSKKCYGAVKGLKHLSRKRQEELKPYLLPFLRKKLK